MTNSTAESWDTVIIGGGTAGLSAAQMLGRARRRTLVVDDGAPRNRFAAHMHGVLGQDGRDPLDLLRQGREEAARYGVEFADDRVVRVHDGGDGLVAELDSGRTQRARTLVVASGLVDVLPAIPDSPSGGEPACCTARTVTAGKWATGRSGCSRRHR